MHTYLEEIEPTVDITGPGHMDSGAPSKNTNENLIKMFCKQMA